MNTVNRQLVTVIAESVIEQKLIDDVKNCGAKGYSVGHVRGEGQTGHFRPRLFDPPETQKLRVLPASICEACSL